MDSFHTISAFLFLFRCSLFCWHHHPPLHLYSRSKGFIPVTHFTGIKAFPWRRSTYSHLLPPLQCPLTLWTNQEVLNLQITVTQPMVLALDYLGSEFWIFFSILVSRSQVNSEYYIIIMWTIDPLHPGKILLMPWLLWPEILGIAQFFRPNGSIMSSSGGGMQGLPPLPKSLTGLLSMGRESLSKASEATLGQVWSLTQFYSKGFSRIKDQCKKGGWVKNTIKVYVGCFRQCPGTSPLSLTHQAASLYLWSYRNSSLSEF